MLAAACSMNPRLATDGAAAHRTHAALCDLPQQELHEHLTARWHSTRQRAMTLQAITDLHLRSCWKV